MSTGRNNPYVTPLAVADGTPQKLDKDGFATLANGTYAIPLVAQTASMIAAILRIDGAIALTATLECNNAPKDAGPGGTITDWSDVAGDGWTQDNSTTNAAITPTGAPWTTTNLQLVAVAGTVSDAMVQVAGRAAARYRLKVVVTTPGKLAVMAHGKT